MNDPEEILPDELLDEQLAELLAPFRDAAVPHEVRARNRAAVAQALARNAPAPWYRRTVAVPLPLAIAASVAIIAASIALLLPAAEPIATHNTDQLPQAQAVATNVKVEFAEPDSTQPRWTVSRSYLSSIESLATTRVPLNSDL